LDRNRTRIAHEPTRTNVLFVKHTLAGKALVTWAAGLGPEYRGDHRGATGGRRHHSELSTHNRF